MWFQRTVIASGKKVVLGKHVRCGANTLIMDTDWHEDDSRIEPDEPVKIGNNVWLGVNVTVLKGVEIGTGQSLGRAVWCSLRCRRVSLPQGPRQRCCGL